MPLYIADMSYSVTPRPKRGVTDQKTVPVATGG
jgi:hypothetical protein